MKYSLFISLFLIFTFNEIQAQTEPDIYVHVQFLEVPVDDVDGFLKTSSEELKSFQQNRAGRSGIDSWRLYRVVFSSNQNHTYNFVSVETASELNAFQFGTQPDAASYREVIKNNPVQKYALHSEIWNTRALVYGDLSNVPSRYKNVNFMSAEEGRLQEYLNLETDIAKPLHQHQTDNGRMDGWNFYRLVFPTGTSVIYNFLTADYYSNLEQIEWGITREVIESVHPDMDVDEFEDFADSIRERAWSDLWELMEYVN
jgi:hypothetical protein